MHSRKPLPAIALAFALSCGDGGGAGDRGAFIASFCDIYKTCCTMAGLPGDGAQCRVTLSAFAPTTGYDPEAGASCLSDVRAIATSPGFCNGPGAGEVASCQHVFGMMGGTAKPGEACESDMDCARSSEGPVECTVRLASGGAEIRKCQVQLRGKEGDRPCAGTRDGSITSYSYSGSGTPDIPPHAYICDVADGVHCTGDGACARIEPPGGPCTGGRYDCVETAYCDGTARQCVARKPTGAVCTTFPSGQCAAGTYCAGAGAIRTCTAQLADGAACPDDDACRSENCLNGKCAPADPDLGLALICGAR